MTDISVIILVGKEELHIKRCLERLAPLEPRQIFIVESQHGDDTHSLAISTAQTLGWPVKDTVLDRFESCRSFGIPKRRRHTESVETLRVASATCVLTLSWHDWPGLQSQQFNWALDNLPISSTWILRLDADEYLTDDSIVWLKEKLVLIPDQFNLLELTLERKFCGGLIRHGTNGIPMVRLFRRNTARYAEGLMDERLIPTQPSTLNSQLSTAPTPTPTAYTSPTTSSTPLHGSTLNPQLSTLSVPVTFYDDSLMPMSEWRQKHRGYAKREAQQALTSMQSGNWTDPRKARYYRLPPYLRAFAYFCIRYFLKHGFLDGYAGWMWNFWQGLWYRCLVDKEIGRIRNGSLTGGRVR